MASKKPKTKIRKALNIILNVLTYTFFALCVIALVLSISAKRDASGAVNLFGMQMRVVVTNSMAECPETDVSNYEIGSIPVHSMVFVELVPEDPKEADEWYAGLKKGDVLTFKYVYITQETITHRIIDITPKETGGYIIELEGDNKSSDASTLAQMIDTSLNDSPNYIVGKVTGQSYPLGLLLTAVKSPIGIVCIVIIPCTIIAIFEIIRIIRILGEGKKRKDEEERRKRDEEFEDMKKRLEMLQGMADASSASDTEKSEES